MSFLLNQMSPYTCTRCGTQSVTMATTEKLSMKCCNGDALVEHKIGHHKIEKKEVKIVAPAPAAEVKLKLPEAPKVMNPSAQPINETIKATIK